MAQLTSNTFRIRRAQDGVKRSWLPDGTLPGGNPTDPGSNEPVLLLREDFEDDVFEAGIDLSKAAIVTYQSYQGTRCVRCNVQSGVTDPIISSPQYAVYNHNNANAMKSTATLEYVGDVLKDTDPAIRTIKWKFRIDDALWKGSKWTHGEGEGRDLPIKGGYFWPTWYPGASTEAAFYTGLQGGNGVIALADNINAGNSARNGDGDWPYADWVAEDAKGRRVFYMIVYKDGQRLSYGPGTGWHEFAMVVDATPDNYNLVSLYIDGIRATRPGGYYPDGYIRVPKTWNVERFSTVYNSALQDGMTDLAEDRTEWACGIQFDQLEIWSGKAV